jgi:two-component system LytT family response regulator
MNTPLKALIVDDEEHARTNLRLALFSLHDWKMVGECSSAAAARACLANGGVDLVLLDVQMPLESGMELARELSRLDLPPLVVFVTAHRGHALDAFDVHALDYIIKPVDELRLRLTLERASLLLEQRASYAQALRQFVNPAPGYWSELVVRSVGRIDRVALVDVQWMESTGNYVELHLPRRTLLHRSTLTELARYLDPKEFLRIHRRLLVRRSQIKGLSQTQKGGYVVALQCGENLPVSDSYLQAAKSALLG